MKAIILYREIYIIHHNIKYTKYFNLNIDF